MNWIERKAAEIKIKEKRATEEVDWKQHEELVLRSSGSSVIPKLAEVLKRDIAEWNSHFSDDPTRKLRELDDSPTSGLTITGSAQANIQFSSVSCALEIRYTRPQLHVQQAMPTRLKIGLRLDKDGTIRFHQFDSPGIRLTYDEISEKLIESVIDCQTPRL
jgi:hypothetical protein